MTNTYETQFHSYDDTEVSFHQVYRSDLGKKILVSKYVTIQGRKLSYQFYLHSHPYVAELVKRLIEKSVPGLQAADTEYSTLVILPNQAPVTLLDGTPLTRSHDEMIALPDGTVIKLPDGTLITLPDDTVKKLPDGTQGKLSGSRIVNLLDGTPLTFSDNMPVTLPAHTFLKRLDETPVMLTSETTVLLPGGKPTPMFYEEFFKKDYNPAPLEGKDSPGKGVFVKKPYPAKDLDFTSRGGVLCIQLGAFFPCAAYSCHPPEQKSAL